MSLKYLLHNSLNLDSQNNNNNDIFTKRKITLKPIKIKSNILSNLNKFYTIDSNKKPLMLKEENYLLKNSNMSNYINNINKMKRAESKYSNYILNISRSNKNLVNYSSINKNISDISINNKEYSKNDDYIKLNSLFSLPSIKQKNIRYNSNKIINTSNNKNLTEIDSINYSNSKSKNQINKKNSKNNIRLNLFKNEKLALLQLNNLNLENKSTNTESKIDKYGNLTNFMKFKYYDDINEKMEKKLGDYSFQDKVIKDKIINMEKVSIFWKNVLDYCTPILYQEKYKNMQKYSKQHSFSQGDKIIKKNNKLFNPKIYTNIIRSKIIHFQNKN